MTRGAVNAQRCSEPKSKALTTEGTKVHERKAYQSFAEFSDFLSLVRLRFL